jgi:hypothetical protein
MSSSTHDNYGERLSISDSDLAGNDLNSRKGLRSHARLRTFADEGLVHLESSPAQQKHVSEDPTTIQIQRSQTKSDSSLESSQCPLQTTWLVNKPSPFILRFLRMSNPLRPDGLDLLVQRNQLALPVHPIISATITQLGMSLSHSHLNLEQPSWLLHDIAMMSTITSSESFLTDLFKYRENMMFSAHGLPSSSH